MTDRLTLYEQGLNDCQIAAEQGVAINSVFKWRTLRGLPANTVAGRNGRANPDLARATPDLKRRSLALLERGIDACLIAKEMNASRQTIERWRRILSRDRPGLFRLPKSPHVRPRHPSGRLYSLMRPERRARAFVLYADGLDDQEIAADLRVHPYQVWEWRNALFLPPVGFAWRRHVRKARPRPPGPAITPMTNPLYARIVNAIGRGLAPDLRDDVASEVWLALAERSGTESDVEALATRCRNRVIANYASRFGARSLDEDLGDGDGFRMIDLLRDERSTSWLEEMGATVW